ncbi:MAG: bifunctional heptose 7-phosphate kinase/heptose 1-phosphate adenyltransferase [Fibrobacterota bacterium]|nr:bifunctional heptose 7-phosphate kinase/heptose 1-phosphate adenyltransferase [Fibrobacterota bacterium]
MVREQGDAVEESRLKQVVDAFRNQTIMVLGDVFIDEYLMGEASRISPEAPVPILHVKESYRTLGGAANTAVNVSSLGGKSILIGMIGRDEAGASLGELAKASGIDFQPVRDERSTIKKTRIVAQRQQLLRLDHEETHYLNAERAAEVLAIFRGRLPESKVVVLSDYAKGFFTEEICQTIIREAKALGRLVIIDPRPQHGGFYVGCDYLTPNWKESQGLLGQPESPISPEGVSLNGTALSTRLARNVLLTCGPKGMAFFTGGEARFTVPTVAREVFDVSGAGDTVVAAFALAKASGCADQESVILANRAAGVVVGKLGTATVTPEELQGAQQGANRVLSREELAPLASHLRKLGRKLVTLNGSFDLLHSGHLKIISEARKQGDMLFVGLNSDASVKGYKGESRPIIPQEQRAEMLLALRDVDYVHIFDEAVPMPFLEEIAPDIHVNGSEYGHDCIEAPTVERLGGRVHIVSKIPGLSTSNILSAMNASKDSHSKPAQPKSTSAKDHA